MLPILQLGPLTLRTPGLALLAGVWFGLELASRFGKQRGLSEDSVFSVGFYSLIAGVIGARLGYVLLHVGVYTSIRPILRIPLAIIAPAPGTEIGLIGIIVGLLTAVYFIRRLGLSPLAVLDAFAPMLALMAVAVGLANLLGGDMYGVVSEVPWAINLWGASRHPTQVYFMIAGLLALGVLWRLESRDLASGIPGQITVLILAFAILFVEPLRADSPVTIANIRTWQVGALVLIILCLLGFALRTPPASQRVESQPESTL